MIFNSSHFFIFLFFTVAVNYSLPQRLRYLFLLFSSFIFLSYYNIESLLTLILISTFSFFTAKYISKNRLLYIFGIFLNILTVILFNYFNLNSTGFIFSYSYIHFNLDNLIIALGLTFYTLQNISYLTDVYFNRIEAENNISKYLLYCSFFPKIVSGPLILSTDFLPQISTQTVTPEKLVHGFNRLLLGLFKKMVIADRLSPSVHSIFDFNDNYPGLTTLIGIYIFTIQLYFDFSGYTDMALGSAKMLGFDLTENFNSPFRSSSISEFWRRWHISLMSWFTIYVFYPIVYHLRKLKKLSVIIATILTFVFSAMWRGFYFSFLIWALCHVIYICFEIYTKRYRVYLSGHTNQLLYKLLSIFIVFNAVCFSYIFFRAESVETSFHLIKNIFTDFIPHNWLSEFIAPLAIGGHQIDKFNFSVSIVMTISFLLFEQKINQIAINEKFNIGYVLLTSILIIVFGIFSNGSRFIYMQF